MDIEKSLDVMHYFVKRLGNKVTDVKLMKLMYFSDRKALLETGFPITDDSYCIMNRGPILSSTLEHLNSYSDEIASLFERPTLMQDEGYPVKEIRLKELADRSYEHLAEIELSILDSIFDELSFMTTNEIVKHAHSDIVCPEWRFPHGTSIPLPIENILMHHGVEKNEAKEIAQEINYYR
ncbi:Panacea domain-containing protein [Pseudoalteromonas gelatinilytica]